MKDHLSLTVDIAAPPERVWAVLTVPEEMLRWMASPEMSLEIETSWAVGSSFETRGDHHLPFTNRGTILRFEPPARLSYTHLSSLSNLPDEPASYATLDFALAASANGATTLTFTIESPARRAIAHHLHFYWRATLPAIQRVSEGRTLDITSPDFY